VDQDYLRIKLGLEEIKASSKMGLGPNTGENWGYSTKRRFGKVKKWGKGEGSFQFGLGGNPSRSWVENEGGLINLKVRKGFPSGGEGYY